MIVFKGIPASEGIAISHILKYQSKMTIEAPQDCKASERELERLNEALEKYKTHMSELLGIIDESEKDLIQAYVLMAETLLYEAREIIENSNLCGELALKQVLEKYLVLMEESGSELIALRKSDLVDVSLAILEYMRGEVVSRDKITARDKIIVAEELTPTLFFRLKRAGIKGIITVKGGVTSHVAILARTYGIPYVIVPSLEVLSVSDNALVIVDGFEGRAVINPPSELVEEYSKKASVLSELGDVLKRYAYRVAKTLDGYNIAVLCNIGGIEDARVASTQGCDGVGLFRVEYLYMSTHPPNEDVLINSFTRVAGFFENKPVVIRAPDLGADKPPPFLSIREDNPLLGLRGIRLLLEYRSEILKPFLRSFLKAYEQYNNLKLMIPMVTKPSEVYEFLELLESVAIDIGFTDLGKVELGIMIETPASAVFIDKFAKIPLLKFVSFGTNDLTQYILAVDRTNPKLMNMYNELEPPVLRVIGESVEKALKHGLKVEICGELASKPVAIPILLVLGFRILSINPRYVGLIKYIISNLELKQFEHLREKVLNADNASVVEDLVIGTLRDYNVDLRLILLFSKTRSPI